MRLLALLIASIAFLSAGCSLGPRAVEATHGRYSEAVLKVDEEQLLRNIVRLRYSESPRSIDVTNIAAQYEMTYGAGFSSFFSTESVSGALLSAGSFLPNISWNSSNRPTVSYRPDDDGTAMRRLLSPITSDKMLYFIQSGWPLSYVLRLWVDQINGIPNGVRASGPNYNQTFDSERFSRAVELLRSANNEQLMITRYEDRHIEIGGGLEKDAITSTALVEAAKNGLEFAPRSDGKLWGLVRRERRLVLETVKGSEQHPALLELANVLNIKPGQRQYEIIAVSGGLIDPALHPTEASSVLRINTNSPIQVYYYLSKGVEVPCEHVAAGLIPESTLTDTSRHLTDGLFRVQYSCDKHRPPDAYVAIRYRGYWYYIKDSDLESKSTFVLMLQMWRLDLQRDLPGRGGEPALTLPVGR
jgi:hypothetical protein